MSKTRRVFSREFKLAIVGRMLAGESVSALARELRFARKELYVWRDHFLAGGAEGLRSPGRPRKAEACGLAARVRPAGRAKTPGAELKGAREQIAELERKVGQQQLELDFFRQALRQVGGTRRRSAAPGVPASIRSSKR
jgi:transposase